MATLSVMPFPARDIFQGYPSHYNMDKPRLPDALSGYTSASYRQTTPFRYHSPSLSNSSFDSTSSSIEPSLKPSLPSISNLLNIANADRSAKSAGPIESHANAQQQSLQPLRTVSSAQSSPTIHQTTQSSPPTAVHVTPTLSQDVLRRPLSPFRRSDSVADSARSPSINSSASSLPTGHPYLLPSMLSGFDKPDKSSLKRKSVTSHPEETPYKRHAAGAAAPYIHSPYSTSPSAVSSSGSYYSPIESHRQPSILGPPLPSLPANTFPPHPSQHPHSHLQPPTVPSVISSSSATTSPQPPQPPTPSAPSAAAAAAAGTPSLLPPTSNPWEHHHYISPSSQASYPPSPDRYICPTCSKAFSRPSSLKIHSHSHTGEKPFKCPHARCGKAFSVRSNMKRHEKGCHVGPGGAGTGAGVGMGVFGDEARGRGED